MKWIDPNEDADDEQRIRRKRHRPKGRRTSEQLKASPEEAAASRKRFADPDLERLFRLELLDEIIAEVKSGKEATVYLARGPAGLLAAKIYADLGARAFSRDEAYWEGRRIHDERLRRALKKRSRFGVQAQKLLWVGYEYQQLWALYRGGVPVPKPAIGPSPNACAEAGGVVLMAFIGDEDGPAPRLADLRLPADEAREALEQSIAILARCWQLGKVHGDFSTYNLLWWQGKVIVIDVPQMVESDSNPHARKMLERDVISLCRTFRRHKLQPDPDEVLRRVLAAG